jgi:hypothetical protein
VPEELVELKPTLPELAVDTYFALPRNQQNIRGLNARLAQLGYAPVPKSSLYRWTKKDADWAIRPSKRSERTIPAVIQKEAVPFLPSVSAAQAAAPDLKGIPQELIDALGVRMLVVAKGTGLDRVEDAIVKVATAIAGKAEDIAEQLLATERETQEVKKDGETVSSKTVEAANAARNAVNALSTLADAMHRITASRTLFSVASRNFAEGDQLSGAGEKYRAEAETTRNAARADNAKNITPPGAPGFDDIEAEDEAVAALREVESQK